MDNTGKQFVISEHTTPDGVHWDLMLEIKDCLWTWRLHVPPAEIKNKPISAERIFDHPLRFLTYEGPVQNGAGRIKIADKGTYALLQQTDTTLLIAFQGELVNGRFTLSWTQNSSLGNLFIETRH
jgi:hypothetical protein